MAVENSQFFVDMYKHLEDNEDWGLLAMWNYEVRIAQGESTGDKLIDYLFFFSNSVEHLHKRAKNIQQILEKVRANIGQEMIAAYSGRGYTGHQYPSTFLGEYTYTSYLYTQIQNGDFVVETESYGVPEFKKGKGYVESKKLLRAKAELLLPVTGYSEAGGSLRGEPTEFTLGAMTFPEHADELIIGKKEISAWRKRSKGNESYYRELKKNYKAGIKQLETTATV